MKRHREKTGSTSWQERPGTNPPLRDLRRNQPYWHLHLRLCLLDHEAVFLLVKPLSLWRFVLAAPANQYNDRYKNQQKATPQKKEKPWKKVGRFQRLEQLAVCGFPWVLLWEDCLPSLSSFWFPQQEPDWPPVIRCLCLWSVGPGPQRMQWHAHSQGGVSENSTKIWALYCVCSEDSSGPCLGLSPGEI